MVRLTNIDVNQLTMFSIDSQVWIDPSFSIDSGVKRLIHKFFDRFQGVIDLFTSCSLVIGQRTFHVKTVTRQDIDSVWIGYRGKSPLIHHRPNYRHPRVKNQIYRSEPVEQCVSELVSHLLVKIFHGAL